MIFCKKKSCDLNHSCLFTNTLCWGWTNNTEHKHMHCLKLFQYLFVLFIGYKYERALDTVLSSTSLKILFKKSSLVSSVVSVILCNK